MSNIKYHFAINSEGHIIDIADVTENNRQDKYYCLNCGDEMRPRLGKKNAHHFAHISTTPDCNPETYLHKLAKLKIKEKFESSAPFEISLRQTSGCSDKATCPFYKENECQSNNYRTYDLHKNYDVCREEQTIGNYRADLLLTSSARPDIHPILIEIYVSHKCEETKTDSGLRIIEIRIKNEEDIITLLKSPITDSINCPFDRSAIKCMFYNFKGTTAETKLEMKSIIKFYLFRSGSAYVSNIEDKPSCREVLKKDNQNAVLELAIDNYSSHPISSYELGYAKAAEMGYEIRNCHLCKYLRNLIDFLPEQNICCMYKKYGTPQYPKGPEATNCPYFRKNHDNAERIKHALETTTIIVCK